MEVEMSLTLDSVSEVADRLTKLAGLVAFAYVLGLGLAYRSGTQLGRKVDDAKRKDAKRPVLLSLSTADPPPPSGKTTA
jgi:hypothetical protein